MFMGVANSDNKLYDDEMQVGVLLHWANFIVEVACCVGKPGATAACFLRACNSSAASP